MSILLSLKAAKSFIQSYTGNIITSGENNKRIIVENVQSYTIIVIVKGGFSLKTKQKHVHLYFIATKYV